MTKFPKTLWITWVTEGDGWHAVHLSRDDAAELGATVKVAEYTLTSLQTLTTRVESRKGGH